MREKVVCLPGYLSSQRRQRAIADATPRAARGGPAGTRLCLRLLQQQLQILARAVRHLDAAAAAGSRAACCGCSAAIRRPRDNLAQAARRAASMPQRLSSRPSCRSRRSSGAACGLPICSSTRCPTTRMRPRATRCRRDFPAAHLQRPTFAGRGRGELLKPRALPELVTKSLRTMKPRR